MKKLFSLKRVLLLLAFVVSLQTFAAFVGKKTNGDGDKKITLKNFSKYSYKPSAYPSLRLSQFQFKGSQNIYQIHLNNSVQGQSMIRLQNGNTTYVYPYKYTVKVPLFKTPAPPSATLR